MKPKNNENKKKILIVDDDPDICVTLREIFKQNGFIADSFTEPLLALNSFRAGLYDLLLLDFKMPEMNGTQLYQEMKKIAALYYRLINTNSTGHHPSSGHT